jgi:hypothetical protein
VACYRRVWVTKNNDELRERYYFVLYLFFDILCSRTYTHNLFANKYIVFVLWSVYVREQITVFCSLPYIVRERKTSFRSLRYFVREQITVFRSLPYFVRERKTSFCSLHVFVWELYSNENK